MKIFQQRVHVAFLVVVLAALVFCLNGVHCGGKGGGGGGGGGGKGGGKGGGGGGKGGGGGGGGGMSLPSQYGLMSTLRVVKRLCTGPKLSPWDAQAFFDCYNAAPKGGIEIYVKCQKRVNGYILNTPENLKQSCREIYKFPQYAMCLAMEFRKAGIDMNKAVDRVNKCEEKLLGTNNGKGKG